MKNSPHKAAFTLIELLVVIAVIGILMAAAGVALKGGGQAQALQTGQSLVNSLITTARTQAVLTGRNAAIVVWSDETKLDSYMHKVAVMVEIDSSVSPAKWELRSEPVTLPKDVYIVPEFAGANFPARLSDETGAVNPGAWNGSNNLLTTLWEGNPLSIEYYNRGYSFSDSSKRQKIDTGEFAIISKINPIGQLIADSRNKTGNNIILSLASVDYGGPGLDYSSPDTVRGAILSKYGIVTLVNERLGFK